MESSELVRSYLRLTLADGVGAVTFGKLIEAFGDAKSAIQAGPARWKQVDGVGPKKVAAITDVGEELVDRELDEAARRGVKIICLEDEAYPAGLRTIYDPPPVLYVWGALAPADAIAMGVVGARRCTHYGLEQADRFGRMLGRAGFTVVSGGARGIDTACHRGALSAGGRTIAVMGCGLAEFYPPENAKLFEQIVSEGTGALVSEIPMLRGVESRNFPKRNRIISGLSLGVLIVEAARRSGSLITARQAAEQGREVFALPGRVDSPCVSSTSPTASNATTANPTSGIGRMPKAGPSCSRRTSRLQTHRRATTMPGTPTSSSSMSPICSNLTSRVIWLSGT